MVSRRQEPNKSGFKDVGSDGAPQPGDYGVFLAQKGNTYGGEVAESDGLGLAMNVDGKFVSIICWDADSACRLITQLQIAAQDLFGVDAVIEGTIKSAMTLKMVKPG